MSSAATQTSRRTILRPLDVDGCGCGARLVVEVVDGLTHRYDCADCPEMVAEFCRKATP